MADKVSRKKKKRDRLDPLVSQKVQTAVSQSTLAFHHFVTSQLSQIMIRQLAFEKLLLKHTSWFSEEELSAAIAEEEDQATGYTVVEGPALKGDRVRIEIAVKVGADASDFSKSEKLAIESVGSVNPVSGMVQTERAIEDALVGMSAGESTEVTWKEDGEEGRQISARIKVVRVSRRLAREGDETQ